MGILLRGLGSSGQDLGQDVNRFFKANVCQEELRFQYFNTLLCLRQVLAKLVRKALHDCLQVAIKLSC